MANSQQAEGRVVTFTSRNVGALPAVDGKRCDWRDSIVTGLTVRVTPDDARSYALVYRFSGRVRRFTLGAVADLTLAAARKQAKALKGRVANGEDPQAAKVGAAVEEKTRQERARLDGEAPRFKDVADAFVKDQEEDWRPATRRGWKRYIESEIKPAFGDKRPGEVTGDDVRALIEGIEKGVPGKRPAAPVAARRCYEVVRRLCTWAVWKRYLTASPCDAARPFERSKRSGKRRASGRAKAFTDDQLRAIFTAASGTEVGGLLNLIVRTGVRSHEARSARWEDIDEAGALWRVPPAMHKVGGETGEPRLVTLSRGALRWLHYIRDANQEAGQGGSAWVFPAATKACEVCEQPGHMDQPTKAAATIKAEAGIKDRGLLHRLRDTIKTRLSEHGVDARVSEHVLGHVLPGVLGTYDHAEMLKQRRAALGWWDRAFEKASMRVLVLGGDQIFQQKLVPIPDPGAMVLKFAPKY